MLVRTIVVSSLLLSVGCTSHEGAPPTPTPREQPDAKPEPEPEPEPEPPKVVAKASITSVQMIQDCPQQDPEPPPPPAASPMQESPAARGSRAPAAAARRMDTALGDSADGWDPPSICTQSTMQLSFTGQGDEPGPVVIREVRLLKPGTSAPLAIIEARAPTAWTEGGSYTTWDEVVPAGGETKASYRLSVPDWDALERRLKTPSFGAMFELEVELEVDGQPQTLRSPQFPRERPHVIVT